MAPGTRWLTLATVSSALFLIVVDMTVLYTALPTLTRDLGATASQKLWIVNAYPLVMAGLLPASGTLGDRLGHKLMFMTGLLVFGLASFGAAFAPSAAALIAARAVLAVGAAMMMPATLSLIRLTFTDPEERSLAIGIWAAIASGGAAAGPVMGGVLLEHFRWGAVFLINVPVVAAALAGSALLLTNRPGDAGHPWDLAGSLQAMIGLGGLVYALKEAAKRDPSWEAAGLALAVGLIATLLFVRRQRRARFPLIDFSLFADPRFSAGVATALTASAALIGMELVFSQRLQLVLGLSPLDAGLLILPIPLASLVAAPLTGLALSRLGSARVLWGALMVTGLALIAFLASHDGPAALWITALAAMGFGSGAAVTAASSVIMLSAPEERAGMAASIEEVSYELGGTLGIALLGSLMSVLYTRAMLVPQGIAIASEARDSIDEALALAQGLAPFQAEQVVGVARAAFDQAFTGVVGVAALMLVAVALVVRHRLAGREEAEGSGLPERRADGC
ncbi:DHA2 family multidrug resistance protein-like MFS transporter [Azospirillum agricola]|uniref:MFS transporter n=1 Tax=Azospirillum agricola TaxID=1720247 RepID=UPI001AE33011|nr:MFS transporter [Azospirillum agricola]MBP2233034.1 DHA2 family multidrug resistance protein-like MFS transporter [Azospirillum agricola]